ncbi:GntR family transcriptional regulator [Pelistega europaea]|uniref:GntR family transcriptional regulator n=1 Tax=Pelistega europaea TaxID=106147 RepID=A0A7Y4P707_9BURK|nr:GntR family transcriptional regulator [Pelistega europaea]NOL50444.1 GntR family transcriptional regulator [Pelistega europaea]
MPELKFNPIQKESLSIKVYNNMKNALMSGDYQPGERLVISEIAQAMGVSITPVREAIFRLVSEQSLELKTATAIHVPVLTSQKLKEIQLIRFHLEGAAAAAAAENATDEDIKRLSTIQDELEKFAFTDPTKTSALNREFHFALMDASKLTTLKATVEPFWVLCGPTIKIFHVKLAAQKDNDLHKTHRHRIVLEALRNKQPEVAKLAIQEDLMWGGHYMIQWLMEKEQS